MCEIDEVTQVQCPECKHSESLLTKKRTDGNWYMCLNNKCFASFFVKKI